MSETEVPAVDAVLGRDPSLRAVVERAVRIAPTRASVLVMGETGTGKELIARILHELGPHAGGPYVAVNCGALSRELAESELFGHERGAFTGAAGRRIGWFEEADGGTLVLDEVGELPPALQPKLLRILETGCLRRVGGRGEIPIRTRVVALTLRDLHREAHGGGFRVDLYHRLSGFEIWVPPLRERPGDILPLAHQFLVEMAAEVGPRRLTAGAEARLQTYDWPGNVRELRNVMRRAAFLCEDTIDEEALELDHPDEEGPAFRGPDLPAEEPAPEAGPTDLDGPDQLPEPSPDQLPMAGRSYRDLERDIFGWALRRHGGSRRRAAQALGISRSTFCDRVKRLGIKP
jgi:DNA-binding NtrC family response regulator